MKLRSQNQFISFLHETTFLCMNLKWEWEWKEVKINALPLLMTLSHIFKFYIKFMSFVYMAHLLCRPIHNKLFFHSVQKMILSWIFQQPKITFRYLSFIFSFYSSYLFSVFYPRCSSGRCDSLKKWSFIQLIQTHLVMKKKKLNLIAYRGDWIMQRDDVFVLQLTWFSWH